MDDITTGKAKDGSEVLLENYDRLIQLAYQNWQYHFEFLNLGYIAYLDFFNFCKEVFPNIPDQSIATMVQGVDMELFRPDDELKNLATLAVELGLQSAFANTDDVEATLAAIARRRGRRALDRPLRGKPRTPGSTSPWATASTGTTSTGTSTRKSRSATSPTTSAGWTKARTIMRPVAELIAEKERIVEEYRDLLDGEAQAAFDAKRQLAATAYPYVENHNFYIEHWTMGVFWRKIRELSRMMHAEGFWTEPEDLLYLNRNEVRDALFDLVTGWGVGAEPIGPHLLAGGNRTPPRHCGRAQDRASGSGAEHPAGKSSPNRSPGCSGASPPSRSSSGWAQARKSKAADCAAWRRPRVWWKATRRVIHDSDQLAEVQQGEILVATVTAPSWGPIFGKIKATVTDIGGMMSHAAIVCREYGLPAVTGTGSGVHHHQDRPAVAGGRHQGNRADPGRRRRTGRRRPRGPQPQPRLSTGALNRRFQCRAGRALLGAPARHSQQES